MGTWYDFRMNWGRLVMVGRAKWLLLQPAEASREPWMKRSWGGHPTAETPSELASPQGRAVRVSVRWKARHRREEDKTIPEWLNGIEKGHSSFEQQLVMRIARYWEDIQEVNSIEPSLPPSCCFQSAPHLCSRPTWAKPPHSACCDVQSPLRRCGGEGHVLSSGSQARLTHFLLADRALIRNLEKCEAHKMGTRKRVHVQPGSWYLASLEKRGADWWGLRREQGCMGSPKWGQREEKL